jgi:hypothetical protein
MTMPGFTASSTLYRSAGQYSGIGTRFHAVDALSPAFPFFGPPSVAASFQPYAGFSNLGTLTVTGEGFSPNACVHVEAFDFQFVHAVQTSPNISKCFGKPITRCYFFPGGRFRVDFPNIQFNCNDTTRITVSDLSGPGVWLAPVTAPCHAPTGSPSPPC